MQFSTTLCTLVLLPLCSPSPDPFSNIWKDSIFNGAQTKCFVFFLSCKQDKIYWSLDIMINLPSLGFTLLSPLKRNLIQEVIRDFLLVRDFRL